MSGPGLVLASASPRRLDLLRQIGIEPAQLDPVDLDECPRPSEQPRPYTQRMAREKLAIARVRHPESFVLAGDTTVAVGRRILGKPEDEAAARRMLELISGRRHRVISVVAVATPDGRAAERLVETQVKVQRLDRPAIERYLASVEWEGKAGAYAIQGRAAAFVEWISGSYSAVVGLPLHETARLLEGLGYRW